MTSEFNDQVTSIALTDIRGALGIGRDSGTWIESLWVGSKKRTFRECRFFGRFCCSAAQSRCLRTGLATKCSLLSPEWLFLIGSFWHAKRTFDEAVRSEKCQNPESA
jgi:hypothetical protein